MTKEKFPYIALALGLILTVVASQGSILQPSGKTTLPLLTLLVVCEFGGIVTAVGAYLGVKRHLAQGFQLLPALISLSCLILAIQFLLRGIDLWPR